MKRIVVSIGVTSAFLLLVRCGGPDNTSYSVPASGAGGIGMGGENAAGGTSECPQGSLLCAGTCTDVTADPAHCGTCGAVCAAGQVCTAGACSCLPGQFSCGGACVDTLTDPANCGTCGTACGLGQSCVAGACQCLAGLTACGATCVDTTSDGANCGDCGVVCSDGQLCAAGVCVDSCPVGTVACGASCADLMSNALHCGACNNACAAGQTCQAGVCTCPTGLTRCGSTCVDTSFDATNCGSCGNACAPGTQCSAGICVTGAGGAATGGAATGGAGGTGGVSTGGVSTGGVSTGGVSTGGVSTGGAETGGVGTGGVGTGGVGAGGAETGGVGTGGAETGGVGAGGESTGGAATGGSDTCDPIWDPPDSADGNTGLPGGLDQVWDHTGATIMAADNLKTRQIMANGGIMRYCIRWDSTTTINATQRDQIAALLAKCETQWIDKLANWGCWPYPEVPVQVSIWAARDRSYLDWPDGDTSAQIAINPSAECPSDCGPWDPRDDHSNCSTAIYDSFFWLDGSVTDYTGWGSATGFMVSAQHFLDAAVTDPDTMVILAHEMGHSHGLDDFYDWQPAGWSTYIMWAGHSQYVTDTDGWMLRDVWRHIRSDYGYPGP